MIRKFNLIASDMKRLIQAKISIDYRNFSHYQMIQALKGYTNKRSTNNIQIKIVVSNLQEGRLYKWSTDIFKNRYQIAQQIFQKYIQSNQSQSQKPQKNKDPFWDPIDFIQQGISYLSLQSLLYQLSYEGYISFVYRSIIIAKAYVVLTPVKLTKNRQSENQTQFSAQQTEEQEQIQIFNHRNLLQKSIYFTINIQSIKFMSPTQIHLKSQQDQQYAQILSTINKNILKYSISYELLQNDYKTISYTTPQIDFLEEKQFKNIHYMRRHHFNNISETSLAYISDCPMKFTLNVMKDYNQECLNNSFQDQYTLEDQQSFDNSVIGQQTPEKTKSFISESKPMNFSKKDKSTIFQNTDYLSKLDKDFNDHEQKKQQRKKQLEVKASMSRKIQKNKNQEKDKDCQIY